jgi:hypothetical protein
MTSTAGGPIHTVTVRRNGGRWRVEFPAGSGLTWTPDPVTVVPLARRLVASRLGPSKVPRGFEIDLLVHDDPRSRTALDAACVSWAPQVRSMTWLDLGPVSPLKGAKQPAESEPGMPNDVEHSTRHIVPEAQPTKEELRGRNVLAEVERVLADNDGPLTAHEIASRIGGAGVPGPGPNRLRAVLTALRRDSTPFKVASMYGAARWTLTPPSSTGPAISSAVGGTQP